MRIGAVLAAATLGAALLGTGPAFADPKHCPPGHAKKGWCDNRGAAQWRGDWRGDDDWRDRRDRGDWREREARERAYEEGYRDGVRDAWDVGDRLPRDRYRVVPDFERYGWPFPGSDRGYVVADDQYYLINMATGLILDVLSR